MPYTPFTAYPPQLQDSSSVNLSGGTLYFYEAGTSTPTNMYSDDAGTSIGSSVGLNASGYPESGGNIVNLFRDTTVDVKVVLKDASDVTIWTSDDHDQPDASMFGIVDSGSDFIATTIEAALLEAKGTYAIKASDESKASDTTLADDATLAGFSIVAAQWYKFEALIDVNQNVGDFKFAFQHTATPAYFTGIWHAIDAAGASDEDYENFASNTVSITTMTDGQSYAVHILAYLKGHATNANTMDFQWAQDTSSANNTTVGAGSFIHLSPIS